jgi:hypothetical protein
MSTPGIEKKTYYTLRIAMAMCFIGHGAFGIVTKQVWCNYFAVFGIGTDLAYRFMPLIGVVDILMGLALLVYPMRALAVWLVGWGLFTALLRPLSGEPLAEFIERAGNYGAPLAMLLLTGAAPFATKNLFAPISPDIPHDPEKLRRVTICLRIVVFLLLAGHGWLNLMEKKALIDQYTLLGFSNPAQVAKTIGILEIGGAVFAATGFLPNLLLVLFVWKMLSETFYPAYPLFEWIERGGSYGCILALWFTQSTGRTISIPSRLTTRKIPQLSTK